MRYDSAASHRQDCRLFQYETASGNHPFEEELNGISEAHEFAKMVRAIEQLSVAGLPPDPSVLSVVVKKVKRKGWRGPTLWYLYPRGSSYRAYVTQLPGRGLLFLHLIEKRRQKRPRGSDDTAFDRLERFIGGTGTAVGLDLGSR